MEALILLGPLVPLWIIYVLYCPQRGASDRDYIKTLILILLSYIVCVMGLVGFNFLWRILL